MDRDPDTLLAILARYRRQFERDGITAEEFVSGLFTHIGAESRDPAPLAPQVAAIIPDGVWPHLLASVRDVLRPGYSASARAYLVAPAEQELSRLSAIVTARMKAWAELLRSTRSQAATRNREV